MKPDDLGRCKGAFHAGRRAAFGRVVCSECGGRFRPLPGLRVPNHIAQRPPVADQRAKQGSKQPLKKNETSKDDP